MAKITIILKGGAGSGNFDHAGRPGKIGGSSEGSGDKVYNWNRDINPALSKTGMSPRNRLRVLSKMPRGKSEYNWDDINKALTDVGWHPNYILRVMGNLKPTEDKPESGGDTPEKVSNDPTPSKQDRRGAFKFTMIEPGHGKGNASIPSNRLTGHSINDVNDYLEYHAKYFTDGKAPNMIPYATDVKVIGSTVHVEYEVSE